jgi:hypothetical protein
MGKMRALFATFGTNRRCRIKSGLPERQRRFHVTVAKLLAVRGPRPDQRPVPAAGSLITGRRSTLPAAGFLRARVPSVIEDSRNHVQETK